MLLLLLLLPCFCMGYVTVTVVLSGVNTPPCHLLQAPLPTLPPPPSPHPDTPSPFTHTHTHIPASPHPQVTIIKAGHLGKRSQGKGRHDWKRRFFVLDSSGLMYYYSHKV